LVWIDETGGHRALAARHGRAPRGRRAVGGVSSQREVNRRWSRRSRWTGWGRASCPMVPLTAPPIHGVATLQENRRKRLKAALKRAELPISYSFSRRHSAATMMLAAGASAKIAADRLGL
jgi:integrase